MYCCYYYFCFKHKTAYEMRISDWSSDVCSSDLTWPAGVAQLPPRSTFCPLMNLPLYSPSEPGSGRKPGYAVSADDVHCHTSPHSCCRPQPSSSEACGCSVRRSEERRVGKGCART